jgi:hypothetical protein
MHVWFDESRQHGSTAGINPLHSVVDVVRQLVMAAYPVDTTLPDQHRIGMRLFGIHRMNLRVDQQCWCTFLPGVISVPVQKISRLFGEIHANGLKLQSQRSRTTGTTRQITALKQLMAAADAIIIVVFGYKPGIIKHRSLPLSPLSPLCDRLRV